MFAKGDRVVLIKNHNMCAKIGATATVLWADFEYVKVIWDRNTLRSKQMDGMYYKTSFDLASKYESMPDPEFSLDEIHEAQSLI